MFLQFDKWTKEQQGHGNLFQTDEGARFFIAIDWIKEQGVVSSSFSCCDLRDICFTLVLGDIFNISLRWQAIHPTDRTVVCVCSRESDREKDIEYRLWVIDLMVSYSFSAWCDHTSGTVFMLYIRLAGLCCQRMLQIRVAVFLLCDPPPWKAQRETGSTYSPFCSILDW